MEESNGAQPLVIVSDRVFAGVDDEARPLGLLIEDGRIIETFPPGCQPHDQPSTTTVAIRIDTS